MDWKDLLTWATDTVRFWGFCSALPLAKDGWALSREAFPRAYRAARRACPLEGIRELWRVGGERGVEINAWVMVGIAMFLLTAGAAIPLTSRLPWFGFDHPLFVIVIAVGWIGLAAASWTYVISRQERKPLMAAAAGIMFIAMAIATALTDGV